MSFGEPGFLEDVVRFKMSEPSNLTNEFRSISDELPGKKQGNRNSGEMGGFLLILGNAKIRISFRVTAKEIECYIYVITARMNLHNKKHGILV